MYVRRDENVGGVSGSPEHLPVEGAGTTIIDQKIIDQESAQVIAHYEATAAKLEEESGILQVTEVTSHAELQKMFKAVKKEEEKLRKMEELLSESEAMGDPSPILRKNLEELKQRTADFKEAVKEQLKSFDLEEQVKVEGGTLMEEVPKENPFLMPALSTVLFEIMWEVMQQKVENKDVQRLIKIDMLVNAWDWAKEAAQAALAQGEAKKA